MPVATMRLRFIPVSSFRMLFVTLIIEPDDRVGVDIFGLPDKVLQNKFPPIGLQRRAPFGMPGGSSRDLADGIKNLAAFDGAG